MTDELVAEFKGLFSNSLELIYSPDPETRNARGVALVLDKSAVKTEGVRVEVLVPGRAMVVMIPWGNNTEMVAMNIYAPNTPREARDFWTRVGNGLRGMLPVKPNIMLGDFNLVEDALDRIPCSQGDAQSTEQLRNIRTSLDLVDGWRQANADEKGYTWARDSDGAQSRIDRIYVRREMFDECGEWEINTSPIPSDHDIVSARIASPSDPTVGRGRWAIPTRLIRNRRTKPMIHRMGQELQTRMERLGRRTPGRTPNGY